jgi:hypothetical protein
MTGSRVRAKPSEDRSYSYPGSRTGWWWAECKVHGRQAHLAYLGGRCEKCQQEGLEAQGLVRSDKSRRP